MTQPYPIGTRMYKEFPSYGWFWGTITASVHHRDIATDGADDYYYDVTYTDGDSETLDHNEIQMFVQYAIDHADDARLKGKTEERATSLTTSTTATSTSTTGSSNHDTDDSDADIATDDDDDESLRDSDYDTAGSSDDHPRTKKRPRRSATTVGRRTPRPSISGADSIGRKRPRRPVTYHGRYIDDTDDDDDAIAVSAPPPPQRTSPVRTCRLPKQRSSPTTRSESPSTNDSVPRESRHQSKVTTSIAKPRVVPLSIPKSSPSSSVTKRKSISRAIPPRKSTTKDTNRPVNTGGSATSAMGIYDKQPYSGGKDLEVISDIQHMFDDMIVSKILSNDRYTSLLCQLIATLQERGPIKIATMCSGTESPILALDMIQNAIHDAAVTWPPRRPLQTDHYHEKTINH